MARRAVVEREELFKAANTLVAEGKEVSAMAVLNELGGGSLTTIYKYLAEWEAGRSAKISPAVSEPPEVVKNAFMSTWRVATMEADREVIAAREKADEEVKAAQKQFEGALQAIQRLEADSEADNAQIEELKKRIADLEGALTASSNDKAALKATSEQLQHQVNLQQTELERLHKEIESTRNMHQEEIAQLKAQQLSAQEKSDAAVREAAELKGQVEALKAQNTELVNALSRVSEKRKA